MSRLIVCMALVFSYVSNAQEPIKGNNTIVVKAVSFTKVKEALLDSGFFIDQQSPEDGTIITKQRGFCDWLS